jgi:hypothetical protein
VDASTYTIGGVSGVFVVGLIVKAVKQTGKVDSNWLPMISQLVGVIIGILWAFTSSQDCIAGIMAGLVLGAAVSGNYDAITSSTTTVTTKLSASAETSTASVAETKTPITEVPKV